MKERRNERAAQTRETASRGRRASEFPTLDVNGFLKAQHDAAEAMAGAYRRTFESWARILVLQSELARSLYARGAAMGPGLYWNRDQPESVNSLATATQGAAEDVARTAREIVDAACECCIDTARVFNELASRPTAPVNDRSSRTAAS